MPRDGHGRRLGRRADDLAPARRAPRPDPRARAGSRGGAPSSGACRRTSGRRPRPGILEVPGPGHRLVRVEAAPDAAEVRRIAAIANPAIRNLEITHCYSLLSAGFAARSGPGPGLTASRDDPDRGQRRTSSTGSTTQARRTPGPSTSMRRPPASGSTCAAGTPTSTSSTRPRTGPTLDLPFSLAWGRLAA